MIRIKHIIIFYILLPIADIAMRTSTIKWYLKIKKMYRWDKIRVSDWQSNQLKKLVLHFYNNTIYYKRVFDELGINPENVKNIGDLEKVPPLTKMIIHEHFDELVPKNINTIRYKNAATGGSTGDPLKYYLDLESWSYSTASNIYSFELQGLLYGDKFVALGSSSLYPVDRKSLLHKYYYKLRNKIPMNGMNMSDDVMLQYIDFIKNNNIKYIYGYASAIYLLAKYVNANNLDVKLKACLPTSEILTEEYRKEIIRAFNCKVMDGYGARDGGVTADEITPGYYHVGYNSICELTDCYAEDTGKLLVTDLLNYAFPFIRYDIGDEVTIPQKEFDCYNGQVITKVFGRVSHVLRLENGHTLTGPGFTILFKDLNVIAYKIYKTGYLKVKIDIQPKENYTKEEEILIYGTLKKHAGSDCEIEIEYFNKFEADKNGKRNYFMN